MVLHPLLKVGFIMSVILFTKRGEDMAVACDSASLVGDWRVPGGLPKMWTTTEGAVVVGTCGNKVFSEIARTCFQPLGHYLNTVDRADDVIRCCLDDFTRMARELTDKRADDGTPDISVEVIVIVPSVNRVYYITGLCLTVIPLESHYNFSIGLGSGGVAAQAAATALSYFELKHNVSCKAIAESSVSVACQMLSSCAYPTFSTELDKESGKWVQ